MIKDAIKSKNNEDLHVNAGFVLNNKKTFVRIQLNYMHLTIFNIYKQR